MRLLSISYRATYGAVPEAVRQNPEVRKIFLPILRADVELLETYHETSLNHLICPYRHWGELMIPPYQEPSWRVGRLEQVPNSHIMNFQATIST